MEGAVIQRQSRALGFRVVLMVALWCSGCDTSQPASQSPNATSLESPAPTSTCAPGQLAACEWACDDGDNGACEQLTLMYLRGVGVPRDEQAAADLNRRLCESGRTYFCPSYAFALAEGLGVQADRALARELFATTCQASPRACSEYGSLYATGRGVQQDLDLAYFLLDLACQYGDSQACEELGFFTTAPPPGQ